MANFRRDAKSSGSGSNREVDRGCVKVDLDERQTRQLLQDVPGVYHTQINECSGRHARGVAEMDRKIRIAD